MNPEEPSHHDACVPKEAVQAPKHFHPVALANLQTVDLSQVQVVNAIQIPQTSLVNYSGISQPTAFLTASEKIIFHKPLPQSIQDANLTTKTSVSVQCNLSHENEEQSESSHLLGHLNRLRQSGEFCDVTLRIGTKSWTTHKCIVSAVPKLLPYLQKVKQTNQCLLQLELPSCFSNDALEICLEHMYGVMSPLIQNVVNEVYRLAMYLQYPSLVRRCEMFMEKNNMTLNRHPADKSLPPPVASSVTALSAPTSLRVCEKTKHPIPNSSTQNRNKVMKTRGPINVKQLSQENVTSNHKDKTRKVQFQCDGCGKSFHWPHLLRRHFATVHLKLKPHKCEKCGRCFNRSEELKQHAASHTGVRNFTCTFCSKKFRHKASLFVHQKIHTDGQRYVCDICGYASHTANVLKIHQQTHNQSRPHKCKLCPKKFKTPQYLRRHEKVHSKVKANPIKPPVT